MEIISREQAKERGLKRYYTGSPCRHGHLVERQTSDGRCIECRDINSKIQYEKSREERLKRRKEYYQENKAKTLAKINEYYMNNKEEILEYKKKWYSENIDKIKILQKQYYEDNKEEISRYKKDWTEKNRDNLNEKRRCRYKTDEKVKMKVFMGRCVRDILVNKLKTTVEILGYTPEDLVEHLENQFDSEMSWDNYGVYGWHVDHIIPVDYYLKSGVTDPAIVNALSNLQPMWASENLSKGAKYDPADN